MSVNPDGADVTDYSDFEYQTIHAEVVAQEADDSTGSGNIRIRSLFTSEPLDDVGGLDNNEVAELVAMEVEADITSLDEDADQDVGSSGRLQGVVGVNLPNNSSALPSVRGSQTEGEVISSNNISESNINTNGLGGSDDRWLQVFNADAAFPFDDQTNGPGGGASHANFYAQKNYRQLVGRGPVLDSNDDITIASEFTAGDIIINVTGTVRVHLIWDVAETSDAGRRFSVPMD